MTLLTLRVERFFLYYHSTNDVNEMTFSSLYTSSAIISIWNNFWMYFHICAKYITFVVRSFNLPSSFMAFFFQKLSIADVFNWVLNMSVKLWKVQSKLEEKTFFVASPFISLSITIFGDLEYTHVLVVCCLIFHVIQVTNV